MVKYTFKYINSYKSGQHAIPLENLIATNTLHGRSIICNNPKEITDLVLEHLKEGWVYLCKEEVIDRMDYIIYFIKDRDRKPEPDSIF